MQTIDHVLIFNRGSLQIQILSRQLAEIEGSGRLEYYIMCTKTRRVYRLFIPVLYEEMFEIWTGSCYDVINVYRLDEHILLCDPWCKLERVEMERIKPLIPDLCVSTSTNTLVRVKATISPQITADWILIELSDIQEKLVAIKLAKIDKYLTLEERQKSEILTSKKITAYAVVANKSDRLFIIEIELDLC